jgi:hypothetical protein
MRLAYAKTTRWLSSADAERMASEYNPGQPAASVPAAAVPAFLRQAERAAGLLLYWLRGKALFRP